MVWHAAHHYMQCMTYTIAYMTWHCMVSSAASYHTLNVIQRRHAMAWHVIIYTLNEWWYECSFAFLPTQVTKKSCIATTPLMITSIRRMHPHAHANARVDMPHCNNKSFCSDCRGEIACLSDQGRPSAGHVRMPRSDGTPNSRRSRCPLGASSAWWRRVPQTFPLHNGEKTMWFRIRGYESGCDDSDADAWPKIVGAVDGDVKAVCHGTKYSRHCARGRARAMAMQWCTKAWWLDPKLQRLPICICIYSN